MSEKVLSTCLELQVCTVSISKKKFGVEDLLKRVYGIFFTAVLTMAQPLSTINCISTVDMKTQTHI